MRLLAAMFAHAFGITPAFAAMKTRTVEWKVGDDSFRGTLVYDDSRPDKPPGLVMMPNWMGLSSVNIERAKQIAGDDYVVLVADMYGKGVLPRDKAEAKAQVLKVYGHGGVTLRKRAAAAVEALKGQANEVPVDGRHPHHDALRRGPVRDSMYSTHHEACHGLYEQGLPKEERHGEPLAQAVSLGIHESQSRIWENQVGRSRAFWEWALPMAKEIFGAPLETFGAVGFYRAVNAVRPGLIRVESDEATYNLHVMLRFDTERALLRDDLAVADLPGFWNERMRRDLGLTVPDHRRGCLQDIHWASGAIGYFPPYTLGNLYAGQLWRTLRAEIPDLDERIGRGDFSGLLSWLRERIGRRAAVPRSRELRIQ